MADFGLFSLFVSGDIMTRFIAIILGMASLASWAVIVDKSLSLRAAKSASALFERKFWSGGSLDKLYDDSDKDAPDPMSAVFVAAMDEWKKSAKLLKKKRAAGVNERIEKIMDITVDAEVGKLETRLTLLSIIGSTSPLLGLFGTVWGIMQSFGAIATSGGNSLNVVAPGVATALSTTALGLIAAIPAVVAFNKIQGDIARFAGKLDGFAGEFSALISRQISEGENA